jgi:hypothetical protein
VQYRNLRRDRYAAVTFLIAPDIPVRECETLRRWWFVSKHQPARCMMEAHRSMLETGAFAACCLPRG